MFGSLDKVCSSEDKSWSIFSLFYFLLLFLFEKNFRFFIYRGYSPIFSPLFNFLFTGGIFFSLFLNSFLLIVVEVYKSCPNFFPYEMHQSFPCFEGLFWFRPGRHSECSAYLSGLIACQMLVLALPFLQTFAGCNGLGYSFFFQLPCNNVMFRKYFSLNYVNKKSIL